MLITVLIQAPPIYADQFFEIQYIWVELALLVQSLNSGSVLLLHRFDETYLLASPLS